MTESSLRIIRAAQAVAYCLRKKLDGPSHGVYLIGSHEVKTQDCGNKNLTIVSIAHTAEEQLYPAFASLYCYRGVMATVPAVVFHSLDSGKFPNYGLCIHLSPIGGQIFGLAHPGHSEQVELAVATGYEVHPDSVGESAVHQQIIELYSGLYGMSDHLKELFSLGLEKFLKPFGCMGVLVAFTGVSMFTLFCCRPFSLPSILPFSPCREALSTYLLVPSLQQSTRDL